MDMRKGVRDSVTTRICPYSEGLTQQRDRYRMIPLALWDSRHRNRKGVSDLTHTVKLLGKVDCNPQ